MKPFLFVPIIAICSAWGQVRSQTTAATAIIEGRVLSSGGTPIAEAEVIASPRLSQAEMDKLVAGLDPRQSLPTGSVRVQSDQAGKFSVEGLRPGTWELGTRKAGYTVRGLGLTVRVAEGQRVAGLVITLEPSSRVSGRV